LNSRKDDINKLIIDNEKLVGYCFKKYINLYNHPDYEDIISEGMIGLIQAANRFDPSIGTSFSTFAVPYIYGNMLRYIREKSSIIKIPRSLMDDYENNIDNINMLRNYKSLEYEIEGKDGSDTKFGDILPDKPDYYEYEIEDLIESFLKTITNKRDRDIMEEFYYSLLYTGEKIKHQYIQDKYNLLQPTVSRILSKYNKLFKKFMN